MIERGGKMKGKGKRGKGDSQHYWQYPTANYTPRFTRYCPPPVLPSSSRNQERTKIRETATCFPSTRVPAGLPVDPRAHLWSLLRLHARLDCVQGIHHGSAHCASHSSHAKVLRRLSEDCSELRRDGCEAHKGKVDENEGTGEAQGWGEGERLHEARAKWESEDENSNERGICINETGGREQRDGEGGGCNSLSSIRCVQEAGSRC